MVRREDISAMQDAWRAYLDLALGLTETSRKKATKVARKLVGRGNATAEQLQSMAEDLVNTSVANREALGRLVRFELERALSRIGLATADEVNALNARVKELEQQLEEARDGGTAPAPAPVDMPAKTDGASVQQVAEKTVAKKTVARKTVAKKAPVPVVDEPVAAPASPARKAPAKRVATAAPAATKQAPVAPAATKQAPVAPAATKQAPARQAPAKKAAAKKAETRTAVAKTAPAKRATKAVAAKATAPVGEPA